MCSRSESLSQESSSSTRIGQNMHLHLPRTSFLNKWLTQQQLNCTTELLPEMALQRAAYLDSLGHPLGPLHGLPISIKEHHGMVNGTNHASFVARIKSPQPSPSGVNDVLWEAGAVFYVRTTQPQCIMHLETSSNIYGTTLNPHNLDLTPGGSSGGESALISFRGSVLVS
jgi:Asp-tRNA(Asn)/Glu-tRNA(Gln) amidotransferase A subunit family amidase